MSRNPLESRTPPLPILPMDIIFDILTRLPVKTLLRFRCLSKQFRSLIDSPDFINHHLQFSSSTPKLILSQIRTSLQVQLLNFNTLDKIRYLEMPLVDWLNDFYKTNLLNVFDMTNDRFIGIIGSCDGLLALSIRSTDVVILCNIFTRKHKILPICTCDPYTRTHFTFGFGRGAGFDDHKLMRVAARKKPDNTSLSFYSLKTGSWRKIVDFPFHLLVYQMASFVKGTLNWLCCEKQLGFLKQKWNILSFDLSNDNFCFLPIPDLIGLLILTVGGECLCLLEHIRPKLVYNIWVMKEYGVKDSWMKMYSLVSLPSAIYGLHTFAFSNHVDKLFLVTTVGDPKVIVWDLKEGRPEIIKPLLMSGEFFLTITSESLVSLGIENDTLCN